MENLSTSRKISRSSEIKRNRDIIYTTIIYTNLTNLC